MDAPVVSIKNQAKTLHDINAGSISAKDDSACAPDNQSKAQFETTEFAGTKSDKQEATNDGQRIQINETPEDVDSVAPGNVGDTEVAKVTDGTNQYLDTLKLDVGSPNEE